MKKKLALTFDSIQQLSKKEQKVVNGGWGSNSCPGGNQPCSCKYEMLPCGTVSINHPCNSASPYYQGMQNCLNYCGAGGCCC
jgi:hypothetical protein